MPSSALGADARDGLGPLELFEIRLGARHHVVTSGNAERGERQRGSADLLGGFSGRSAVGVPNEGDGLVFGHTEGLAGFVALLEEPGAPLCNVGWIIVEKSMVSGRYARLE